MKFESIFPVIGDVGKGQIIQYFLLCWPFLIAGVLSIDVVFLMATPNFVCKPDEGVLEEIKAELNLTNKSNATALGMIAESLYLLLDRHKQTDGQCYQWNNSSFSPYMLNTTDLNSTYTTKEKCSNGFIYSNKNYGVTITNELDLVCDYGYVRTNLKTVFFVGRIIGAICFGQLSDLIGRLYTFLIVVLCNLICGLGLFFANNSIVMGVLLLFQGFTQVGYTLTTYVLGCEMVGPSKRKYTGTISQLFYTAAFIFVPLIYLWLKSWRYLVLISGIPALFFLTYFFIIFESPRWLLTKGKTKKALSIIEKVGKLNNKEVTEELRYDIMHHIESEEYKKENEKKYSIIDLFKTKKMCCMTVNICYIWVVNSLVYYGIIYNAENLSGSLYLNFIILGLVEIPAYLLNMALLDVIGRKKLLIISMIGTGIACVISGSIPRVHKILISTFAMIGKLTITMSYGVIYFYTLELYPTVVRNAGMGLGSMSARVGGTLAMQILSLRTVFAQLPMIVFCIIAIIASGTTLLLSETMGTSLDSQFIGASNEKETKPLEMDEKENMLNDTNNEETVA